MRRAGPRGPAGTSESRTVLEAPHRRRPPGPRLVEKATVLAYRGAAWLLAHVPTALSTTVVSTGAQASYLAWPSKRRSTNLNLGHVLGLPPDDPRVRALALRSYREYGRYLVELMRLPSLPRRKWAHLVEGSELDGLERAWKDSPGGLILVIAHVGNNEAVAAGVASRGWPISVVADDSSFPELFDLLRRQREVWGVQLIPWRNLRGIYTVLRRREMLALLVDWGYRPDGIPVRLFDAWTTLPAGPATLAAKTNSWILPIVIRRSGPDRFHLTWTDTIVARSGEPAELLRITQEIARALEHTIGSAPEQWYNFKPIWPATADESARLEARAAAIRAGLEEAAGPASDGPAPATADPARAGAARGRAARSIGAQVE